jgi:malate dehydrogenase (oxaloacetate-decarboxylating)(NADP+)
MEEFVETIRWRWPKALIQFEDFSNEHAFGLLEKYRNKTLCFNDDIQGTAAVVLAGLLAGLRIQHRSGMQMNLRDQRIVFLGAGSAGVGVAELIAQGMVAEGKRAGEPKPVEHYRKNNFWLIDSKGLVTSTRGDKLQAHKIPFARDEPSIRKCK